MKKLSKRITSLLLAAVMVLGLTACGEDGNGGNGGSGNKNSEEAKKNVYKYQELDFGLTGRESAKDSSNIMGMQLVDGRAYAVIRTDTWSEESSGMTVKLNSVNADGTDKQEQTIAEYDTTQKEKDMWLGSMVLSKDRIFVIEETNDYNNVDENGNSLRTLTLICWDFNGQELWRKSILPENVPEDKYFHVENMFCKEDGSLLLMTSLSIDTYDGNGELLGTVPLAENDGYGSMFLDKNGNLCVTTWNEDYTKQSMGTLDTATGQLAETQELPGNFNNYSIMGSGKNYDLIVSNSTGIFGYNMGDADVTPVMNYINSDLPTTSMNAIMEISDTQFMASYYDNEYYDTHVAVFTYVDPKDIPDKDTITLASYWMDSRLRSRVIDFNKTSDKYRITVKDYSQYNTNEDWQAGYTQLNNDILAGNIPDIMVLNDTMPIDSYIAKGLFADINEYLDNDPELNREDYFENVFNAFSVDGKMYRIVPSFYVWTVIGKTSDVGETPGWTMADLQALMATKPEGTKAFSQELIRDDVMRYAMAMSSSQFLDVKSGKCNFNSDGFIELLEFMKEFPKEYNFDGEEDFWRSMQSQYMEGRTVLFATTLYATNDLVHSIKGSFGEEPVTFIGFPTENGLGSAICAGEQYAISAKTKNKEAVWEFMRYYYTDEFQNEMYNMPVNKEIWKEKVQAATRKPSYEDENGNMIEEEYTIWLGDTQMTLNPLTQEEVDKIYEFVLSLDQAYYYNEALMNIINEEAAAFFEGQKSSREVADIIQSRAQIYVNENR